MIEKIKKDQRDHKLYKKQNMIIEVIKKTKVIKFFSKNLCFVGSATLCSKSEGILTYNLNIIQSYDIWKKNGIFDLEGQD